MEVALVDDEDGGCAELAQVFDKVALTLIEVPGVGDDKRDVDPFEHGPGAFDSGESESADIVDARRVDEDDGTDRREFARLFNGVGRGAGDFGDDRDLLVGQCVDERALAGIALAEEADVKAKAFGGFNHDFFQVRRGKKRPDKHAYPVLSEKQSGGLPSVISHCRSGDPRDFYFSMLVRMTSRSNQSGA